jgi:hypothetical protein
MRSAKTSIIRAGLLRRIADEAKNSGTFKALTEGAVPYEEINGLFGK